MSQAQSDVVVDRGKSQWSDLFRKEDYWAIWVGFFCMAVAIWLVFANWGPVKEKYADLGKQIAAEKAYPIKTIEWYNLTAAQKGLQGQNDIPAVKWVINWLKTPARWKSNPWESLYMSEATAKQKNEAAPAKPTDEAASAENLAQAIADQEKATIALAAQKKAVDALAKDEKAVSEAELERLSKAASAALAVAKDSASKWQKGLSIQGAVDQSKAVATAALADAQAAQDLAKAADYKDENLNQQATAKISTWQAAKKISSDAGKKIIKPFNRIWTLIVFGIAIGVLMTIGAGFMGFNVVSFFFSFLGVYVICVIANILGNQTGMRYYGVNAEIWSIALGMLIANTCGTPRWLKEGAQVEYYIKAGLVLLGAEVLFHKILAIGTPGIFVAWVVTPIVLVSTFIFGQKVLKMPSKSLNIVISADMSVCGTSAAIATAAAARAKKEELTLSIGLSLTFTAIMMIVMPAFIKAVGMPEILGGAWIGGTVDSTGAVAAAGAFLGEKALAVAATVKMIQNVLIGVTAFCVALYWTTKVEPGEGEKVGASEIWNRFPKFVIGFLAVSVIMSIISYEIGPDFAKIFVDNGTNKISVPLRGWFFGLSFVAIGLTTDFRVLGKYFKGGKPIILYVCGQSLNLALTLLMAWIMFYKIFPNITNSI